MNNARKNLKTCRTRLPLLWMFALCPFFLYYSQTARAQTHLIDVIGQPVLSYGAAGEWDDAVVSNPAVIKDGDTLRMWFMGRDESIWTASTKGKIGYAWSINGYEWHKSFENPVVIADLDWEKGNINDCAVIKDDSIYKMWYGAAWTRSSTGYEVSPSKKIGYAESLDGLTWVKHSDPVLEVGPESDWDSDFIVPHTVIKEENEYKMWFWAGRPGFPVQLESHPQIGMATSVDGLNWIKHNDPSTTIAPYKNSDPVLKLGSSSSWDAHRVINPIVLPSKSGYKMWYTGLRGPITPKTKQQIGYAYSVDGIAWHKWPENPVLDDSFTWGKGIYGGSVLNFDDTYHFWFACFHTPPSEARPQIGYANSRDIYIPDYNFLLGLREAEVDASGDGLISRDEAAACSELDVNNKGISNFTGLEAFVNLMILNCGGNALDSLVIKNSGLLSLACHDNQLTHLDVSNDSMLINLYCNNNKLTELDISQNPRLHTLYCGGNQLSALNISGNQKLGKYDFPSNLDYGYPPWIDTISIICDLDLADMPTLNKVCTWVGFTKSFASESTSVYWLAASDAVFIKMEGSPNIQFTTGCTTDLGFENTEAENIGFYPNPTDGVITLNARLSESSIIEVISQSGQLLWSTEIKNPNIQIDLSSLPNGIYFINVRSEDFVITKKIVKLSN